MSGKITKVIRLDLSFSPDNGLEYKTFCQSAFEIQKQIRSAKNAISSAMYFDLIGEKKLECGYTRKGTVKSIRAACYDICSSYISGLYSGNVNAVSEKAYQPYQGSSKRKELYLGICSAASYKSNQPIEIRNKSITVYFDSNCRMLKLKFFSNPKKNELDMKTGEVLFKVVKTKDYQNAIFDRIVSGEYLVTGSSLMYDRKKKSWFINLGYTFTPQKLELDPGKILGVDIGQVKPFYAATDVGWDILYADNNEIKRFQKNTEERRRKMLHNAQFASPGNCGHGRKKRMKAVDRLSEKVKNFRETKNFVYAKSIVEFAIKQGCGTIQLEDLSGISINNKMLKNWPYFDLQMKIESKAKEYGIVVRKINPYHTSNRCHRCGWIDKDSRISQSEFVCTKCGHKDNADRNAARNIAMDGIEKIIKDQCTFQGFPHFDRKRKPEKTEAA